MQEMKLNAPPVALGVEILGAHKPAELSLDQCIKCNICLTACPVSPVTDLFPGPKYEGPQSGRFRQPDQPSPDHSVDYCNGCRVCNMVCPTGVRIAEMNARARARLVEQGQVPWRARLRNNLVARPEMLGRLALPVAPLANLLLGLKPARWLAGKVLHVAPQAPLPRFARRRFTSWFRRRTAAPGGEGKRSGPPTRVAYFHGCSTQYYEPRIGRAAVYVLEAIGCEVVVPPQNCCGLPLLSNGEFAAARRYHAGNISKLIDYARDGYAIVGTSTSCTLTLKEEAPELLDYYDEEAQLLAAHTYDFHEFLRLLVDSGALQSEALRPVPLTLAYHAPCQYRAHRLGMPGLEILEMIPELRIVESQAACCGIGGTYGFKSEKYAIAMEVGRPLFDFVRDVGGPVAVCDSETCRWQIEHGSGLQAVHPVELLAVALGYEPEEPLKQALA